MPRYRAHRPRRLMRGHFRLGCTWFCSFIGSRDWSPACISGCARRRTWKLCGMPSTTFRLGSPGGHGPHGTALAFRPGRPARFCAELSCQQDIAADGAFSLGMLARFEPVLRERGAAAWRELFWEAGMIGQSLYLAAEAAGVRGTGIGCYFDDELHRALGLKGHDWQSLYHFTIGNPVEDLRLRTTPPYAHLKKSDNAQRLRQNSPFAGVLTSTEVWEVKSRFRHAPATA
jgi:hypothetical protein